MKRKKLLYAIPLCLCLMSVPGMSMRAGAVTVDISDNYDAGLLEQEYDSSSSSSSSSDSSDSSSSANSSDSAASTASSAAQTTAATTTASSVASTTADTTTDAASTASTTNDLPQTGDDDRILITFTVMLTSLAVFLTTLLAGRFGKNV